MSRLGFLFTNHKRFSPIAPPFTQKLSNPCVLLIRTLFPGRPCGLRRPVGSLASWRQLVELELRVRLWRCLSVHLSLVQSSPASLSLHLFTADSGAIPSTASGQASTEVGTPLRVCPRRSKDPVRAAVASSLWRPPSRPRPSGRMATGRRHATRLYPSPLCLSGLQPGGGSGEGVCLRRHWSPRSACDVTERLPLTEGRAPSGTRFCL